MPVKTTVKKKHTATAAKTTAKKPVERELVSFDFAVKYLLRGKRDYVVLNGFLSELLGKKVEVKSIDDPENIKTYKNDKVNRVDIKARINGGELAIFEIQFLQSLTSSRGCFSASAARWLTKLRRAISTT